MSARIVRKEYLGGTVVYCTTSVYSPLVPVDDSVRDKQLCMVLSSMKEYRKWFDCESNVYLEEKKK